MVFVIQVVPAASVLFVAVIHHYVAALLVHVVVQAKNVVGKITPLAVLVSQYQTLQLAIVVEAALVAIRAMVGQHVVGVLVGLDVVAILIVVLVHGLLLVNKYWVPVVMVCPPVLILEQISTQ